MPRSAVPPRQLLFLPFRGTAACAQGLLTRGMLQGPAWVRLFPDVYLHRDARLDHRTWCDAAALLLPAGAAVGGLSAAYLWGVDLLPAEAPVSVAVPRTGRMRRHSRLAVRYTALPDHDVTRFAGIPLTTPLRTAFDLGRRPPLPEAVVAMDALLNRRLLTLDELRAYAEDRPWAGSRQLTDVLTLAEPLTESPMETRLRLIVVQAGLPRPVAQHDVRDREGRFVGRLDLAYPDIRLGLEYEGDHHRDRATFRHDMARTNALRVAGWTILRFTADDVLRHPRRIIQQIDAILHDPRREPNATHVKTRLDHV